MPHRYFTRELADGRAALTGSDAHHLADVMRARIGEEVVLCGPDGLEYLGTVTAIEPGRVEFSVTDGTTSNAEPDCAVTLFAGYPKAGKLEEVIRHSVELGVTEVVPFFSRYCVATPKKEDVKNERYNRIAVEAAKQKAEEELVAAKTALEKMSGPKEGQAWIIPDLGLVLEPIPTGRFPMGSANGISDEKPVTQVKFTASFAPPPSSYAASRSSTSSLSPLSFHASRSL